MPRGEPLSVEQEESLYNRMRVEVNRLQRLRAWLAERMSPDGRILRSVDVQIAATLHTCETCTRCFDKKAYSRHRKWRNRWPS